MKIFRFRFRFLSTFKCSWTAKVAMTWMADEKIKLSSFIVSEDYYMTMLLAITDLLPNSALGHNKIHLISLGCRRPNVD